MKNVLTFIKYVSCSYDLTRHVRIRLLSFLWELRSLVKADGKAQKHLHVFSIKLLANFG